MNKLRSQPSGDSASGRSWKGGSASGRSWKWYFNPRAMSSSTRNADPEPLSLCIFITSCKEKLLTKSQSHFLDCQNQCKELTLHLEKQTSAKGRRDLPALNHPFRRLLEAFVWLPACKDFQSSFTPHLPNQKRKPTCPPPK